jgi:hypothetical protein
MCASYNYLHRRHNEICIITLLNSGSSDIQHLFSPATVCFQAPDLLYRKHGRVEKCIQKFQWENLKGGDYLEGIGVLKHDFKMYRSIKDTGFEDVDWIHLAQDTDQ